ncbi:V-set domain-containing T-cell activation inhibitor 1-like [Mustelus asterias]
MMLLLCSLLFGLLFGHIETFIVSSDEDIAAEIGNHVILNCAFDSHGDSNPTVIWQKIGLDQTVHKYRENENDFSEQHKNYTKRTELHGVNKGDASLTLKNVNIWDEGTYKCSVYNDNGFGDVLIHLSVWAQCTDGIHIVWKSDGNGNDMLSCQSSGWYPKPEVSWKDKHGNDLNEFAEVTLTRDNNGFFSVEHDLKQDHDSKNQYICSKKHQWMTEPLRARAVFTDGGTIVRIDDGSPPSDL